MAAETARSSGKGKRRGGRAKGTPNAFTADAKACIEQAFHKLGGRDYLVRVGKRRPDVFLQLFGKILPAETKLSILAQFQALPLPVAVEEREAIPYRPAPALELLPSPGDVSPLPALPAPSLVPLGVALGVTPDDDAWEL